MDRLQRTRALIGDAAVARLTRATVMVVGCGAVGSVATEALARTGIGHLVLIDFDRVQESNINRQLIATQSTVGMPKVDAARARIADLDPNIAVDTFDIFFDDKTDIDVHPDFVIDAIDSIPSKIALYKWCAARNIAFIASMGAARKTDTSKIKTATIYQTSVCPLAARVRKLARQESLADFPVVFSTETARDLGPGNTLGSMMPVTGTFGFALANFVINKIAGI